MHITRLKCRTLMWFYSLYKEHGDKTFVLYRPYVDCKPTPPKYGTAVTDYYPGDVQWLLCDGEDLTMIKLCNDPNYLGSMSFDFMKQLSLDIYDWEWIDDLPSYSLIPQQNLINIGITIGYDPGTGSILWGATSSADVKAGLVAINN